jgi:hypothetical protein
VNVLQEASKLFYKSLRHSIYLRFTTAIYTIINFEPQLKTPQTQKLK